MPVRELTLGRIGVDVVDVDVDGCAEELWDQAQVPGADSGFLAHFPQGRSQKGPVILDVASRRE